MYFLYRFPIYNFVKNSQNDRFSSDYDSSFFYSFFWKRRKANLQRQLVGQSVETKREKFNPFDFPVLFLLHPVAIFNICIACDWLKRSSLLYNQPLRVELEGFFHWKSCHLPGRTKNYDRTIRLNVVEMLCVSILAFFLPLPVVNIYDSGRNRDY